MTTQIGRTVLLVRDPEASAAFYRDAFGFATLFDETTPSFRFLHVGPGSVRDPGLWLKPAGDAASARPDSGPSLVLYVDDLGATVDRLAALGVGLHAPVVRDAASRQAYAHVLDPDGYELVLVELPEPVA
ncbi:VOC family protein [Sanguibacter sp. 25GB23B1]|uniref:VOC family protein n=1 Tax=unclassified Sanguibacter TaxID=2645534 RepID=UPI0032AFAFD2